MLPKNPWSLFDPSSFKPQIYETGEGNSLHMQYIMKFILGFTENTFYLYRSGEPTGFLQSWVANHLPPAKE